MIKRFLELVVFIVILGEIFLFAAQFTNNDIAPTATETAQQETVFAQENKSGRHVPGAYMMSKVVDDRKTLEGLAENEAKRMIQSGDTEAYIREVEKHRPLLNFIAPGL